ncbi:MAG: cytochrome oxidase subunit III [Planctomycetes bacterium]|nr:cytochrome oxidase subunit III [Planctomycetota bacterium]
MSDATLQSDLAQQERARRTNEVTVLAVLAVVTMLFAAFTASYLIRRTGTDWGHIQLPSLVWVTTVVLALSSGTLELARKGRRGGWLGMTLALGLTFVVLQVLAWQSLAADGVFAASHPHSAFYYMLTGVHAVHVIGGIGALLVATKRPTFVGLCALYWHFVGLVWVWVLLVLKFL